ncbi:response regulator transcription factor [Actinoplanes derwentensis]|uniref:response regulator transcription factor n=1 Tax=Actinoplanes derwentensis TaxID=113562 RepID=UPI001E2C19CB|nr:LuxR C-terminal-related transcriptional regulator [Actinoplanes derwentensis]
MDDGSELAGSVREADPDVVLVDLQPPTGLPAVAAARAAVPQARILAIGGDDPGTPIEALRAGASGVVPRGDDAIPPLLAALEGWAVVPVPLLNSLVERAGPIERAGAVEPGGQPVTDHLDEPDRRLLRLIATGSSTSDIAGMLHVSDRTVKRLTAALLRKLHVSSRTEAAALAGSAGLV